jgi:hypothetical protein
VILEKKPVTIDQSVTDSDVSQVLCRFHVQSKVKKFRQTGNPVYAVEAFLLAQQEKIETPKQILEWLTSCLKKWHDGQATESLGRIMGLEVGKGKTPPYKAALIDDRNEMLYTKIAALKSLGLNVEDSAEMVSRGHEDNTGWNISRWRLAKPSAEWLYYSYTRWPARHTLQRYFAEESPKWSHERIRKFLSIFPPESISRAAREALEKRLSDS